MLITLGIILHKYTIHISLLLSTYLSTIIHYTSLLFNLLYYFLLVVVTLLLYIKFSTPVYNLQI